MSVTKNGEPLHADGPSALAEQIAKEVRSEVECRYSEQLAEAGIFKRLLLRRRIEKDIQGEVKRRMPSGACY